VGFYQQFKLGSIACFPRALMGPDEYQNALPIRFFYFISNSFLLNSCATQLPSLLLVITAFQ